MTLVDDRGIADPMQVCAAAWTRFLLIKIT